MIPTTLTQRMGAQPVAVRRRAAVCAPAYVAPRATRLSNVSFTSGLWGGVDMGHATTPTIKRPTRHLVPRTT
mgnify:CR=1 FL=1